MTTALITLTNKLAATLDMGDGTDLIQTLKATAFKGQVSDAQMTALMVVANQYGLNPWTKEIYAFPDKNNGIVPVVGVDGWARIINNHPQFDGMEFEQDADSCTCVMYRKDRTRPVKVTEYMVECKRAGVGPWASHPYRMLRHKAMIQCARLAFGYGGIYDTDEAERIVEAKQINPATGDILPQGPEVDLQLKAKHEKSCREAAKNGWVAFCAAYNAIPKEERHLVRDVRMEIEPAAKKIDADRTVESAPSKPSPQAAQPAQPATKTLEEIMGNLMAATSLDALYVWGEWIETLNDKAERKLAEDKFNERQFALEME